jgi:hypothetical protein
MSHTLAEVFQYASQYIRLAPLTFVAGPAGGRTADPALSIGDWVRQTILAPPFAWRWNRSTTSINTVVGTQDYVSVLSSFGWLEKAAVINSGVSKELEIALVLGDETQTDLPTKISAQIDDGASNITFRLLPVPDKIYSLKLTWQQAAPSFAAISGTWAPLPDYMFHIYSTGVLAKAYEYLGDARWPFTLNTFLRQLVSFHGGLTESQINLFMNERTVTQTGSQDAALKTQQRVLSRGLS